MNINIKILKKGDSVISVFNYAENVAIAIKRKNGQFEIVLIEKNKENIPEISANWAINEGDGEIEIVKDNIKVSTF